MKTIHLDHVSEEVDTEVEFSGWVTNIRSSGKIVFLQLRDGYGFVQAIVDQAHVPSTVWHSVAGLSIESAVTINGKVSKHPKKSDYEIQVHTLIILSKADEYPISNKEHGIDFLLDNRHLWLRSKRQWAILRIRDTLTKGIYDFMAQHDFLKIDAPIITPNACEGTTDLFALDYFDKQAYLSQSGQLYIEAAIFAHRKVFDFGPTFRAEKSKTRRHLTEFWMMDAEVAFADHNDNMETQEKLIMFLLSKILKDCTTELALLERDSTPLQKIKSPFLRKTHTEVVSELQKMGSTIKDGADLGAEDETILMQKYDSPIFVEKYPAHIKAFYMKRDPDNMDLALCSDLLAPEGYGEIIGGSQREDDYDILKKRIEREKLPLDDFQWYLDLRKYGSVVHSGFGLGLERLVTWICGLKHVREAIPFPRTIYRLKP